MKWLGVVLLVLLGSSTVRAHLCVRVMVERETWTRRSPTLAISIRDDRKEQAVVRRGKQFDSMPVVAGLRLSICPTDDPDVLRVSFRHVGILLRYCHGDNSLVATDTCEFDRLVTVPLNGYVSLEGPRSGALIEIWR